MAAPAEALLLHRLALPRHRVRAARVRQKTAVFEATLAVFAKLTASSNVDFPQFLSAKIKRLSPGDAPSSGLDEALATSGYKLARCRLRTARYLLCC